MNKSKFLASLALLPFLAFAGLVEETLTLANGWNAVYIESTPANSDATAFWGSLPVTKASCYVSSVYSATAQLASDGASISQKPVSHLVWDANDTANSTMGQVAGGCVYVVLATNDATKTFLGTPQIPRVSWQVSDGGFCTFAPVSVPAGQSVASSVYFGEGPCGETFAAKPYSVWGDDADAPKITPKDVFSCKPQVEGGKAYAFESASAGEWPGVLGVSAGVDDTLDFGDGFSTASFAVRNLGKSAREVRVSLESSADPGDVAPTLYLHVKPGVGARSVWDEFSSVDVTLAAGESRTFAFLCDKTGIAAGEARSAVMSVEDLGGTKMRVRFPVTAEADTYAADEGAYPAGLWIGSAKISQVGDRDGNLMGVGKPLTATVLMHVGADGTMALLQRVAIAQEPTNGTFRAVLYGELSDVPADMAARRVSSVFMDTANRAVAASANIDSTAPEFGREATFRFTVGERSKENPFRHAWHPDHDGKRADYSGDAPSGDVAENFVGPVKPESFSVTNTLVFTWADDDGRSTYSALPDETTFGRLDWTLAGLRKEPVKMRALFSLRRVSNASEIK